jgi:uncharacterized OB-fold protein
VTAPDKPVPVATPFSQPYWDGAIVGELRVQRCQRCHEPFLYPRRWCPSCWSPDVAWEVASGRGSVFSFSVVTQPPLASYAADVPYVLAVVRLAEGPQLMANVVGLGREDLSVGQAVQVVFERRGDLAVPQFEVVR